MKDDMIATWYQRTVLPKLLTFVMGVDALKEIRKKVIAHAFGDVLEIGSGPGYNLPFYQNINKLYALEPSEKLIEEARKQPVTGAFSVTFLEGTAESIPLPDKSVDTVISTWTLCSVQDPRKVLDEIKRVLRPGGNLVFIDHGVSPHGIIRFIQKMITPLTKAFTGNCHHDRPIEQLILDGGLQIDVVEHPSESRHPFIYNSQGIASKRE